MRQVMLLTMIWMALASGCATKVHDLAEQYHPLERVKESPLRPGTGITTLGRTAYVNDLDEWLAKRPPGSALYHAILLHEREHTVRQLAYGQTAWLGRYLNDTEFMWAEESRGWYIQLKEYQRRGLQVNPEGVAKTLAAYMNISGRMISYEDALTWVRDVLAGRWSPPNED